MNDRKILLTYLEKKKIPTYEWFVDKEELYKFLDENTDIDIIECFEIESAKELIESKIIDSMYKKNR